MGPPVIREMRWIDEKVRGTSEQDLLFLQPLHGRLQLPGIAAVLGDVHAGNDFCFRVRR
jgi:hypothetical protein